MNKIIIEIGSASTKIDKFDGNVLKSLDGITIQFKKH